MAGDVECSAATLSAAAAGERLPSSAALRAYVSACGGDLAYWERRWREVSRELSERPSTVDDQPSPYPGLAHGAIVTASSRTTGPAYQSGGGINVFIPAMHGGLPPASFADSISTGFPGAHGVLWDDGHQLLLAIGHEELRGYTLVTDTGGIVTGLSRAATLTYTGTGHDLQPDYSSKDILHTVGGDASNPDHGVWKTRPVQNSATGTWSFATPVRLYDWYFTKSFVSPDGLWERWVDALPHTRGTATAWADSARAAIDAWCGPWGA